MPNETAAPSVPVGTLAKLLNLTEVRVQQLAKMGVVVKGERGRYDLWGSIRGYVRYLQERNLGKGSGTGEATSEGEVSGDDYAKHRARLYKARADAAELEAQALRGRLHEASAIQRVWDDMISACRSRLLGLPTKMAGPVREAGSINESKDLLEEAVREALDELSNYDPGRIAGPSLPADQPGLEAPAEVDGEPVG